MVNDFILVIFLREFLVENFLNFFGFKDVYLCVKVIELYKWFFENK